MKQINLKLSTEDEANLQNIFNARNNPFHTTDVQSNVFQLDIRRKEMTIT